MCYDVSMGEAVDIGLTRIVSGGQTGVDQAALQTAIDLGIPHGGWCPRGRLSEAGRIPARFRLTETESAKYWVRTERNVLDSDGTLLLYCDRMYGGTALTYRMTRKHRRPALQIDLMDSPDPRRVQRWLAVTGISVLNVAGPRESSSVGVYDQARSFLRGLSRLSRGAYNRKLCRRAAMRLRGLADGRSSIREQIP